MAREPVEADLVGRAALEAWQTTFERSGLPVAGLEVAGGRARFAIASPLPAAARGDAELLDVWLLDRVPRWHLRGSLEDRLPAGHSWVDAEDVWLGAPPLPGQVAAADWNVEVACPAGPVDAASLASAIHQLLDAREVSRTRVKGGVEKRFDLRPLVIAASVADQPGSFTLRTRIDPEIGAGRPEDVVAALAEMSALPLSTRSLVRVRLLLVGDPALGR